MIYEEKNCGNIKPYKFLLFYKKIKNILSKFPKEKVMYYLNIVGLSEDKRIIINGHYSSRKINHLGFSVSCRFLIALGCLEGYNKFLLPELYIRLNYRYLASWVAMRQKLESEGKLFYLE